MKYHLDIADRERAVEVQRQPHGYRVAIDGRMTLVDAVRVSADTWSLIIRDGEGRARSVDASVVRENGDGSLQVYVEGHRIPVTVRTGRRRVREDASSRSAGPQRVIAPMPGKIVRVLVKQGDFVRPRQGLVVVEAMKMENELRAIREGRVRDVFVVEGQPVEAGTALVTVE
jgi:biotin carboxyl carrier protein